MRMGVAAPMNLKKWVNDRRDKLKPPVGNQCMYEGDFIIAHRGGAQRPRDYRINTTEEFFFQIGRHELPISRNGKPRDIVIREGDVFMLPANIPHSPQPPAGTVRMVVEHQTPRRRRHLRFNCEKCGAVLHEDTFEPENTSRNSRPPWRSSDSDALHLQEVRRQAREASGPIMPVD